MALWRFDRSRWDDIRVIRWPLLPTVLLALLLFPPHFETGNPQVPAASQRQTVAAMADNHCLDTPGPHRFILCRQVVRLTANGRQVNTAVTVTQEFFEAHLDGLPVTYDSDDPARARPTHAPGVWWFLLDGLVKVAMRGVPGVFVAFAIGLLLAKAFQLERRLH